MESNSTVPNYDRAKIFFGFHPASFIDDVYTESHGVVSDFLEQFEQFLLSEPRLQTPELQEHIQKGLTNLEAFVTSEFDYYLDKFEIYLLRNVFSVPPEISLPDTRGSKSSDGSSSSLMAKATTQSSRKRKSRKSDVGDDNLELRLELQDKQLDDDISHLREKIAELRSKNEGVRRKCEGQAKLIAREQQFIERLTNIMKVCRERNVSPFNEKLDLLIKRGQELLNALQVAKDLVDRNPSLYSCADNKSTSAGAANTHIDLESIKSFA